MHTGRRNILFSILFAWSTQGYSQFIADTAALRLGIISVQKQVFFDGSGIPSMTYTEFLNDRGLVETQTSWNNHLNSMSIKKYFFYDTQGKRIREQSVHYDRSDSVVGTESFTYNKYGLLDSNGIGRINYTFNTDSLLIEKVEKTAKPYDRKSTFEYDNRNRLSKVEMYFYTGLESRTTFEYDSNGRLIKEIKSYFYDDEGNPDSQYEHLYEYDDRGLLITEYQDQTVNEGSDKLETRIYRFTYQFRE